MHGMRMPQPARPPVGLRLARTARAVSRALDDALGEADGSLPVWLVLISLKSQPVRNQRQLADAVGIREATLTHHLNAMDAQGLVTRTRDPANRRVHQVRLTDQGEAAFRRLRTAALAFDRQLRHGITDDETAALDDLLRRLERNVAAGPAGQASG
jgi:MarR family transcriptional regulator, transcriptional regulator for hemolysin